MTQFVLELDTPYQFCTQPGLTRSVHCADFRDSVYSDSIYRDETTGLLTLLPSHLSRTWAQDMKALDNWTHAPAFWQDVRRAQDAAGNAASLLTTVKPASTPHTQIEILTQVAITAIQASALLADDLKWALESKFYLESDEGFNLHYHGLNDELLRKSNWFSVMWDNVALTFSTHGEVRVYQYDRAHLNLAPKLLQTLTIANPGDLLGVAGYFTVTPIPLYGILLSHKQAARSNPLAVASANSRATRSVLIAWPTSGSDGSLHLFERSLVRIGLNPYQAHVVGFQNLRYPVSGGFVDGILDLPFIPTSYPADVSLLKIGTGHGGGSAQLNNTQNTAIWTAGTDRQGRVALALGTSDARYTPFVYGYGLTYTPVYHQRNTTPVSVSSQGGADRLTRIEWSEDEYGRTEGTASLLLSSAEARTIAERGDGTFTLRASDDGINFSVLGGGFVKFTKPVLHIEGRQARYECDAALRDVWERLDELHQNNDTAYDGVLLSDAFNRTFQASGFPPVATFPAVVSNKRIPQSRGKEGWKFGTNTNDDGGKIIGSFLLLLRSDNTEYRARFDWSTGFWFVELKPRFTNADAWTVTAFTDEESLPGKSVRGTPEIMPESPEANIVSVWGLDPGKPGEPDKVLVKSQPLVNYPSLNDPNDPDYLGRGKQYIFEAKEISDQSEINLMARRLFDAMCHRRLRLKLSSDKIALALRPNTEIIVRGLDSTGARARLYYGLYNGRTETQWLKRKTLIADGAKETMLLETDSIYLGGIE